MTKISELPAGTTVDGTEKIPAVQNGVTVYLTQSQLLALLTLSDTKFTLQDDGDATKQARFQCSGIATATIRTYTFPDASGTLLYSGGPLGTPLSGVVTNLTGTASININGTVGATTPTTGAFTNLTASGTFNLNGATGAVNAGEIWTQDSLNSLLSWNILNNSTGTGACSSLTLRNNNGSVDFILYGGNFTGGLFQNRGGLIAGSPLAGLLLTTVSGSSTIDLAIGNSKVATVTSKYIGSTIAGTATDPSLVVGTSGYGFYQPGANQMGWTVGGGLVLDYGITTSTSFTLGAPFIGLNKIVSNFATGGIGYATGAGGSATQGAGSGKSTTVAFNAVSGAITMNNAALAAATIVSFTFTNTAIAATDVLILNHISGGTPGSYTLNARAGAGSATIDVRNNTAGSLSEAIVIQFAVIKAVNA